MTSHIEAYLGRVRSVWVGMDSCGTHATAIREWNRSELRVNLSLNNFAECPASF